MTQTFYTLAILVLGWVYRLAALFVPKAKKWVAGRKNWSSDLQKTIRDWPEDSRKIWMHCASLGEFEQGRPLIELIKQESPDTRIVLTFFSPSGYEVRKDYPLVDWTQYLPLDTPRNAARFLDLLQPELAIFVKYEFWFNFIASAKKRRIPLILIAGLFRERQYFFGPFGKWFLRQLGSFRQFYVQNESSARILTSHGLNQFSVVGDPRVDRVLQIAQKAPRFSEIEAWKGDRKTLVVGSSWPPDEEVLFSFFAEALREDWCVILAPHDISTRHIRQIEDRLPLSYLKYSSLKKNGSSPTRALIIDNIGMLSALYQYGDLAYVGGGFGAGIHNTLEPMAFRLPVIFGPKYQKFKEAEETVAQGGSFSIKNTEEMKSVFSNLLDTNFYENSSDVVHGYLQQSKDATTKIYNALQKDGQI